MTPEARNRIPRLGGVKSLRDELAMQHAELRDEAAEKDSELALLRVRLDAAEAKVAKNEADIAAVRP